MNIDSFKEGIPLALLGLTILAGLSGNAGLAISILATYLATLHTAKWF